MGEIQLRLVKLGFNLHGCTIDCIPINKNYTKQLAFRIHKHNPRNINKNFNFRNIMTIYLKAFRNKAEERNTMEKIETLPTNLAPFPTNIKQCIPINLGLAENEMELHREGM